MPQTIPREPLGIRGTVETRYQRTWNGEDIVQPTTERALEIESRKISGGLTVQFRPGLPIIQVGYT
jgi:hypothetical protein